MRFLYLLPILVTFGYIGYLQYKNWLEFRHEGNGANRTRIALMVLNASAFVICLRYVFQFYQLPGLFVGAIAAAECAIYWPQISKSLQGIPAKVKALLKKKE